MRYATYIYFLKEGSPKFYRLGYFVFILNLISNPEEGGKKFSEGDIIVTDRQNTDS